MTLFFVGSPPDNMDGSKKERLGRDRFEIEESAFRCGSGPGINFYMIADLSSCGDEMGEVPIGEKNEPPSSLLPDRVRDQSFECRFPFYRKHAN